MKYMTRILLGVLIAVAGPVYGQSVFNKYGPVAGIQKSTGSTYQNTAAASADVIGLWSGCTGSNFLRGDGTCTVPAGTGVSSVTVPAPLTATSCTGGACAITWTTAQTANRVLATPDGTTGAVSLRALVAGDIPPINLGSTANGGVSSATILLGTNGGTSNGFFSVTGPATSLKTFTFPNASATVLTSNAAVTVAQGGTGLATLTAHGVLLGEGTSNVGNVAAMAADTLLQGQGTGADPAAVSVNNCGSSTTALSYSTSTHTFGCQTISVGGSGTVTSISQGTGITATPNPIVSTGTIAVDQTASLTWTGTETFTGGLNGTIGTSSLSAGTVSNNPKLRFITSTGSVGQRAWEITGAGATLQVTTCTDAFSCTAAITVNQTSGLPTSTVFAEPISVSATTFAGPALTVSAPSSGTGTDVSGASGSNALYVHGNSASGNSFGMRIDGGTTSADFGLLVDNQAGTTTLFKVGGSGVVQVPAIGTTASAANAFIDNTTSNTLLRSTSSRRYKQDIHPLELGKANEVLNLQPITYRSKAPADDPAKLWFGLIAEDVAAVEPRLVAYDAQGRPDGVQYDRIGVLTLRVVQDQQQQLALLRFACVVLFLWCTGLTWFVWVRR